MLYNCEEVESGKEYWAYGYETTNSEKSMGLKACPYKCIVEISYKAPYGNCIKLNKNGKPSKSNKVKIWSRKYADTKEEAILGYNKLIDKQINLLKSLILEHEKDKIVEYE